MFYVLQVLPAGMPIYLEETGSTAGPYQEFHDTAGEAAFVVPYVAGMQGASTNNRTPSLPQRPKCGASSFSRVARGWRWQHVKLYNDLAATIKNAPTNCFLLVR